MEKYYPLFLANEKSKMSYCIEDSCTWWNEETGKCGVIKSTEKGPSTQEAFREISRRLQEIEYGMVYPRSYTLENKPPVITCNSEEQKRFIVLGN